MFRSFLAIELVDELKNSISKVENEFKKTGADIKYVPKENMHFTLKFFGDISENKAEKIANIVSKTLRNYEPFIINIHGCGAFPNENHIKVIWIGADNNKTLTNLQKELDNEFSKIGFKKERNYKSHLTIGRMKSSKNKDQVKKTINKFKDKEVGPMVVNEIILKKSTLTPQGPIYENLKV